MVRSLALLALFAPSLAFAQECPDNLDTRRFETGAALVLVRTDSDVTSAFCGGGGTNLNEVRTDRDPPVLLGVQTLTSVGTTAQLGVYLEGDEIVLSLTVPETGKTWYSGDPSRNSDGAYHASVVDLGGGEFWVGFTDHDGGHPTYYADTTVVIAADARVVPIHDADGDSVGDQRDQCPGEDDTVDVDGSGIPDCIDGGHGNDLDLDGVLNEYDVCRGQDDTIDSDADGWPDCAEDSDGVRVTVTGYAEYGYCYGGRGYTPVDYGDPVTWMIDVAPGALPVASPGHTGWGATWVSSVVSAGGVAVTFPAGAAQLDGYTVANGWSWLDFIAEGGSSYGYAQVSGRGLLPLDRSLLHLGGTDVGGYGEFFQYDGVEDCYLLASFTGVSSTAIPRDSDGDGVPDVDDACPGSDDAADADADGVADGCDACPADATGDSDGDGACDSADPCPLDIADDSDVDGICDSEDLCAGGDDLLDADLDAIADACDACPLDAANDADGDGVCGNVDTCVAGNDWLDVDADGTPDACDACPLDAYNDSDGDGACDSDDACPFDAPDDPDHDGVCTSEDVCRAGDDHADLDLDQVADACDACPADALNDADGDGTCGDLDNCPALYNANQSDVDQDGIGDACEPDTDADGVRDDDDNCRFKGNPAQADGDHDGIGDACEADTDGDRIIDDRDLCPATPGGALVDGGGCSLDQRVPCNGPWKNHGAYVSAYGKALDAFVSQGLLTSSQRSTLQSAAARSSCGK